ncbi:MAG: hypothetical protein IKS54_10795 [Erysipelotrichaceae bacterium]|nr:hypothetical protein [Erysipelotrichaceae bacterium]
MQDVIQIFKDMKKHLTAGIGYLIPVICVGGICCGLGVAFGGTAPWEAPGTPGFFFFMLGKYGLNLMPAVIAAFVAYSIGDKVAIGPGLIIGQVSQDYGAGFIGGVLAGIYVGILVVLLKKIKISKNIRPMFDIIVIPFVVTVTGAFLMETVVAGAVSALTTWLEGFMNNMGTANLALVAAAMGFFSTLDLGLFLSKALSPLYLSILGSVDPATGMAPMIAQRLNMMQVSSVCIPPLVCAFATFLMPKLWTPSEKQSGLSALFLGLCGITEGAIPMCLTHINVYVGCVLGGTVAAVATCLTGLGTIVNWGGIPNIFGCTSIVKWLIVHACGIAAGVLYIAISMKFKKEEPVVEKEEKEVTVKKEGSEITLDL